jgi:leucyl-tRNA synthetase
MDPKNPEALVSPDAEKYWQQVDLYIGGTEHATGHLLYSRFWHKFLKDLGFVSTEEPFKKLVNQGMIQGVSAKAQIGRYFDKNENWPKQVIFPSHFPLGRLAPNNYDINYPIEGLDLQTVNGTPAYLLTEEIHQKSREKYFGLSDVQFPTKEILFYAHFGDSYEKLVSLGGNYEIVANEYKDFLDREFPDEIYLKAEPEKMSKSKYNVVNPDDICAEYGADTLRLYEMFLGPLEQSKPWNTNGIEGVFRFLRKLWRLYIGENGQLLLVDNQPTKEELKALHRTIKKTQDDIEALSLNTSVSSFMVCVNELSALKSKNKSVLTDLLICIAPYAPHIAEELWSIAGMPGSVTNARFPAFNPAYLVDDEIEYPISINGKVRDKLVVPADTPAADIEKQILAMESVQKWMEGKPAKKVIVVPKKIVNVVV